MSTDPDFLERFRFDVLHQRQVDEQNFFWQRFIAFSALNAGLFVLAASTSLSSPKLVKCAGVVLGAIWAYIQCLSYYYFETFLRLLFPPPINPLDLQTPW